MNKKIYLILIMIITSVLMFVINSAANIDADFLLTKVDEARAPGNSFSSLVDITTMENKEVIESNSMKVLTKIMDNGKNRSIALTLKPENQKGRKILLIDTDTWLYIPGAKKSIMISPAQKLSGNVSTGDILSVNYRADYSPEIIGQEKIGKTNTYKLELMSKNSRVTYYRIILYINKENFKPVKAEYYSKSGKLLKKGYYRAFKTFYKRELCTELLIIDEIFNNKISVIKYLDFKLQKVSDSYFNKDLLKDIKI